MLKLKRYFTDIKKASMLYALCSMLLLLAACSKTDPVLPGTRHPIFHAGGINLLDRAVPDSALADIRETGIYDNTYRQDSNNVVWRDTERVFSGLPTSARVAGERRPMVAGDHIIAGLSTGEVVKVNRNTKEPEWVADVFRTSAMTGGSSILDIVAPVVIENDRFIYAGGLGNAFCKLDFNTGARIWCADIGVGKPFIVRAGVSYVVGTNGFLYAIDTRLGDAFWRAEIRRQAEPKISGNVIAVG
ncbi:MAG: PQQ-like beta-propeller repeat protein, partial [Alphaproteobacteria bacterium]|nr:PQQ-like beta-propeller repeat protein [Alphaproteobacteria bacterium]